MSDSTAASTTGQFQIKNGQILDPNGNAFTARGIALDPSLMGATSQILKDFPGLNFVRLTVYNYDSPDTYAAFINTMTAHGIVVELEDHTSSDGANQGGSRGTAFTGAQLTNELNWYSSVAKAYATNPYVWFGTDNEPPNDGLTAWQQQTYNAIRDAGNNNPIMLELPGGAYPGDQTATSYGMDPKVYAGMSNILMDVHLYGWSSNFVADQPTVNAALTDLVQGAKTFPSANGAVPVIIGEYGISTDGDTVDANGNQVLQAAQQSNQTVGAVAFTWSGQGADTLTDGQGNLTAYGKEVAQWIASGTAPPATGAGATSATVSRSDVSTFAAGGTGLSLIGGSQDPAGLAGNGGTTYVLPAAGAGPVHFTSNILGSGGTLDLTAALSATDWNGMESTLPNYLTVTDVQDGAVVSLATTLDGAGTLVATIPGAGNLTLATLLAHSIIPAT